MREMNMDALWVAFEGIRLTQYHESGHAVADYFCGFRPKRISGALSEHDRRTTSFFRTRSGLLVTPSAREKAQLFAVTCIAGIAAESKVSGVPLEVLRRSSGIDDYEKVQKVADSLANHRAIEDCEEVTEAYIRLWEARAVALMNRRMVWSAVESLARELDMSGGEMAGEEIKKAIQQGIKNAVS